MIIVVLFFSKHCDNKYNMGAICDLEKRLYVHTSRINLKKKKTILLARYQDPVPYRFSADKGNIYFFKKRQIQTRPFALESDRNT